MERSPIKVACIAVAVTVFSMMLGTAQNRSSRMRVAVPFAFTAGSTQLPAGSYYFTKVNGGYVDLSSADGKTSLRLNSVTSLARSSSADDHLLAFDKIGGERILSEVWIPDQNGLLVHAGKGEHEHDIIRLTAGQSKK